MFFLLYLLGLRNSKDIGLTYLALSYSILESFILADICLPFFYFIGLDSENKLLKFDVKQKFYFSYFIFLFIYLAIMILSLVLILKIRRNNQDIAYDLIPPYKSIFFQQNKTIIKIFSKAISKLLITLTPIMTEYLSKLIVDSQYEYDSIIGLLFIFHYYFNRDDFETLLYYICNKWYSDVEYFSNILLLVSIFISLLQNRYRSQSIDDYIKYKISTLFDISHFLVLCCFVVVFIIFLFKEYDKKDKIN